MNMATWVLTSTSIASFDTEVFRWILRTGCGFWFDERLMSANGTKRTFQDVRYLSAFGGKADITPRVLKIAKLLQ